MPYRKAKSKPKARSNNSSSKKKAAANKARKAAAAVDRPLEPWRRVKKGRLLNGFSYVVVPNGSPPNRVEAWLEVKVRERLVEGLSRA